MGPPVFVFAIVFVFAVIATLGASVSSVQAQETVFNVPSPDILDPGKLYFETDHYVGSKTTDGDRARFFLVRGGHNWAIWRGEAAKALIAASDHLAANA